LVELGESSLVGYYSRRDYAKARDYFDRAAAQGFEDAKFFLAQMRLRGWGEPKDPAAGLASIRTMAANGNVRAAAYLAYVHYWGAGEAPGAKKDEAAAFQYTRQAAEKGDVWALASLAFCYEHGIGTPTDYAQAARIYWRAYVRGYQPGLEKTITHLKFVK
jgi:TPR repeat protein